MTRQKLVLGLVAAAALFAAVFFLINLATDDDRTAGQDSTAGHGSSGDRRAIVLKDRVPEKKGNTPQKIDPADYTTAPKPHTLEGRLIRIFADRQIPDGEKVERLLIMASQLPPPEKGIALDYATQLITDEDYLRQRPRLLRLADSDELRQVVMLDMLTRDDRIKMPSLVELLKVPSQTTRADAREILEAFLDKDYGDDPRQWEAPVQQWLAETQEI